MIFVSIYADLAGLSNPIFDSPPLVMHPRAFVRLFTSVDGEDVETGIQPTAMAHHRASHNKADEVEVELDASAFDFPID